MKLDSKLVKWGGVAALSMTLSSGLQAAPPRYGPGSMNSGIQPCVCEPYVEPAQCKEHYSSLNAIKNSIDRVKTDIRNALEAIALNQETLDSSRALLLSISKINPTDADTQNIVRLTAKGVQYKSFILNQQKKLQDLRQNLSDLQYKLRQERRKKPQSCK